MPSQGFLLVIILKTPHICLRFSPPPKKKSGGAKICGFPDFESTHYGS